MTGCAVRTGFGIEDLRQKIAYCTVEGGAEAAARVRLLPEAVQYAIRIGHNAFSALSSAFRDRSLIAAGFGDHIVDHSGDDDPLGRHDLLH